MHQSVYSFFALSVRKALTTDSSMRPFDFAIELRCSRFDVDMLNAVIFNMPVETGLKLMSPVGSDHIDAEWELADNIVDELDGTRLIMIRIDLQGANARRIVDGGVLEAFHDLT